MSLRSSTVLDGAVETVGDDDQRVAEPPEQVDEAAESRIDIHCTDEGIHLGGRGAHQIDLAHHALTRADAASLPLFLDVPPCRSSEALEKKIGRIDRSDRSIEIDENTTLHTRS